uniref:Uncharacterized protein n=1 Tax=Prymnesium polylepis TaxID=72548 RepID=A0A7S4HDA5_9EUKA
MTAYSCSNSSHIGTCWGLSEPTDEHRMGPSKTLSPSPRQNLVTSSAAQPHTRSPVSGSPGSSFHFLENGQLLGAMQAAADDRSLPPTPRSPSPTCSPPSSPKRQRNDESRSARSKDAQHATKGEGAGHTSDSAAEDDLETRAAALGLNETTQRVWRETNLPPTPSSPSPTFSPPSSPKQRRQAELVAEQAAAVLAASLGSGSEQCGAEVFCDSDSDSNMHTQGVGLAPPDTYWGARTSDASVACSNFTTGNLSNSPVIAAMRKKRQL